MRIHERFSRDVSSLIPVIVTHIVNKESKDSSHQLIRNVRRKSTRKPHATTGISNGFCSSHNLAEQIIF